MNKLRHSDDMEYNLESRAQLFKALGHPSRLLILNLLKMRPRHGEELAAILRLKPATISHHVGKLIEVSLISSTRDQYYQTYTMTGSMLEKTIGEVVRLPQSGLRAEVEEDAYREQVLRTFFRHGRISHMPAQLKKRLVILEKLADEFEPEREYPEREVNQILLEFNEDVATLRRGLVDHGLMVREGGLYRRKSGEQNG